MCQQFGLVIEDFAKRHNIPLPPKPKDYDDLEEKPVVQTKQP